MKYLEFVDKTLTEVAMSPTSLQQMAANINAIAGMEFEMIVPNAGSSDDDEMEEDWDADMRARSFEDIKNFFYDGDYNSRRTVENFIDKLEEQYREWTYEQFQEKWENEGRDFFHEYVDDKFDEDSAIEDATEQILTEYPDVIPESDEFMVLVKERVNDLREEWIDEEWNDKGRYYGKAYDSWFEDAVQPDEEDYLTHLGIRYMSDVVANTNVLTWPHWVSSSSSSSEDVISNIADSFSKAVKRPHNFSTGYHTAKREANKYVIEPDGSLDPDDDNDSGLEFISPPLPLNELIGDLKEVKKWAKANGCYTNESCGLHMNVSIPDFSIAKLDYVKLALLSGDTWVLDQFGRLGNTYAKSAMQEIKRRITDNPADSEALLKTMKSRMDALASKIIHSGNTAKYTSINTKDGWVEFRSPGGDWLNDDLDKLTNTLLRFVVALDAALDPQKFRQEYLKKLYSILKPTSETDTLSYFASYSAGALSKEELKKFVQQSKLERDIKKSGTSSSKYWWKVTYDYAGSSIELVAASAQEALAKARQEWDLPSTRVSDGHFDVKPVRPVS